MDFATHSSSGSSSNIESSLALGAAALLLLGGASRRRPLGAYLALSSLPLLYRGITGHWPSLHNGARQGRTRTALAGTRGVHVRESVRLEVPLDEVYRF